MSLRVSHPTEHQPTNTSTFPSFYGFSLLPDSVTFSPVFVFQIFTFSRAATPTHLDFLAEAPLTKTALHFALATTPNAPAET